ncbi:MAG: hypothetical protein U0T82_04155 [Bacteroidales bacterium]
MIERKGYFFSPFLPIGVIFIFIPFYQLIAGILITRKVGIPFINPMSIILLLIGISFFLVKGGYLFNPEDKSIIKFVDFIKFRIWSSKMNLPRSADLVEIHKTNRVFRVYGKSGASFSGKKVMYEVFLVDSNQGKYNQIFLTNKFESIEFGKILADMYNIKLVTKE